MTKFSSQILGFGLKHRQNFDSFLEWAIVQMNEAAENGLKIITSAIDLKQAFDKYQDNIYDDCDSYDVLVLAEKIPKIRKELGYKIISINITKITSFQTFLDILFEEVNKVNSTDLNVIVDMDRLKNIYFNQLVGCNNIIYNIILNTEKLIEE